MSRLVACVALLVWMAAWTGATAGTYPISYHLTRPGRVSLVVTDTSGSTVREILRAVPLAGGDHTSIWDGLDREGKGVPAGTYRWRLLETQGLSARYELSVGSSYPRGEDRSSSGGPGSHIAPYTMAADETGIYVAALQTENLETGLLKLSPDGGKRLWSQQLPFGSDGRQVAWEGGLSMAVDRGEVYLLGHREPQRIFVSRADTGRGARAFEVGWDAPSYDADAEEALTGATDMDVRDGVLVVAYSSRNVVRWYDPMTGKSLGAAGVAAPAGVAVGPAGTVYVTTGDKIVRLSRERPAQATIAAGLTRPGRLAVDRSNGELLVFQRGDSQQVRRLTAAGQTLRIYGIAGGRREGLYVDRDFAGASDIAADGRGGFLIAEPFAAPRRVAQVARDGAVSHEWYGGQPWAPSAVFEAGNPDVMWVTSAKTKRVHWVMRVLVDHAKKIWRVHSCYRYAFPENPLMGTSGNEGSLIHIYEHDGAKYLAIEGWPTISKLDEKRWRLVPVTAFGSDFQWNDANGDGLVQDDEKTLYNHRPPRTFAVPHLAASFDFYFVDNRRGPCQVRRYRVTGWNAEGAPVYGDAPDGDVFGPCPARLQQGALHSDERWGAFLHRDEASGDLYAAFNPGTWDWCSSADSFVQVWSPDGRLSWSAGELGPAAALSAGLASRCTPPGSIYRNLRGLAGVAYGNLIAVDVDGGWQTERAQTYVWDRDGLFVGGIMDAVDLDAAPEVMYHLGGELAHATVATFPDGKVYFAGNWENEVRLYEVSGWDGWERQTGELLVKHAAPDSVGQGLTAEYFRDEAFRGPAAVRVEGRIALDGRAMRARAPEGSRAGPHSARWRGELVPTYGPRYAGAWTRVEDPRASGGALHLSHATGDRVECKFRGTSIKVLGLVGRRTGVVNVELDGKPIATNVDLSRDETAYGVTLFERAGLSRGDHVIVLESRGTRHSPIGGALAIERFVAGPLAIDADGLPYTFHVDTTGEARLWLDGTSLLSAQPHPGAPARLSSTALKLERRGHPIQLSLAAGTSSARITLSWSSPLDPERPVPERALFPVVHDARSAWAGAADGLNQ